MTAALAKLLTKFFSKEIIQNIGESDISKVLEGTLKRGKATPETMKLIRDINKNKDYFTSSPEKEKIAEEAIKRLSDPTAYKKKTSNFVFQDIILPLLGNAAGLLGTAGGMQMMLPALASQAAQEASNKKYNQIMAGSSPLYSAQNAALNAQGNIANLLQGVKSTIVKGAGDIADRTINNAASTMRAEDERARINQMMNDKAAAYGQAPVSAEYDLQNRILRNEQENAKKYASGGF